MPREVKAWSCAFKCGRRPSTNQKSVEHHERTCFRNPARRACKTCEHEQQDYTGEGGRWCEVGVDMPECGIVWDCPLWAETGGAG